MPCPLKNFLWRSGMFGNYLKITIRTLQKSKLFSTINILGRSIGMAACLLIMQYVTYENSYDSFHQKADQKYPPGGIQHSKAAVPR